MDNLNFEEGFLKSLETSQEMANYIKSTCVMLMLESNLDWDRLKRAIPAANLIVVSTKEEIRALAESAGYKSVVLPANSIEDTVSERLPKALFAASAKDLIRPGTPLAVLYSGFDPNFIDSLSIVRFGEQIEKMDWRFLRKIETDIPMKTLKVVANLARDIGREGREGKAVGTMFVIGDTKKVMQNSRPVGFDPVRGYTCKERSLFDAMVREGIKEVAQLDGAFIISRDGVVRAGCRLLNAPTAKVSVSKGFGSRHWAAAAITKVTNAVAIVVSQSDGVVRIFQGGTSVFYIPSRTRGGFLYREDEKEPVIFGQSAAD